MKTTILIFVFIFSSISFGIFTTNSLPVANTNTVISEQQYPTNYCGDYSNQADKVYYSYPVSQNVAYYNYAETFKKKGVEKDYFALTFLIIVILILGFSGTKMEIARNKEKAEKYFHIFIPTIAFTLGIFIGRRTEELFFGFNDSIITLILLISVSVGALVAVLTNFIKNNVNKKTEKEKAEKEK